ncbi:ABC transporter ATP-binding protein [Tianweitania sediminis]|uniref:ABC transporter ATP-binding protein n=2 Tax=Tianweitania sediminis TaxID=1502156 RepID=A0A8J7RKD8_9HYPH|nr:ABC transporter ATP-binding protein [Tianweitania sediminis]
MIEPIDLRQPRHGTPPKLQVEQLSKSFGSSSGSVQALAPFDLSVEAGDFLCVVGPSGCGKTTLLNIVAGFESPTSGSVYVDGKPVTGPGADRGVVFQQGALFNWMTILDNVAFGPRSTGFSQSVARQKAMELLELVGLSAFAKKYPYQLSGGMQQRVGIARALANNPQMLLMDEPFAALDQQTRELLQEEIRSIWQRTNKTILWITHSIEEALLLATHIIVMTARPGRTKASFVSPFARSSDPHVASSMEFAAAKRTIFQLLRGEAKQAQQMEEVP